MSREDGDRCVDNEERLTNALGELRRRGARITSDRLSILTALSSAEDHITAEQLADRIAGDSPEVNRATVYRTLDLLESLGIVFHSHLGHGPSFWHFADELHHHLVCENCGESVEIPEAIIDTLTADVLRSTGFALNPYHFSLTGSCRSCRSEELGESHTQDVCPKRP